MRKALLISGSLIFFFLISIYLFIPETIIVEKKIRINASDVNSFKYLSSITGWEKWWPDQKAIQRKTNNKNTKFCYQTFCYELLKITNTGVSVQIEGENIKNNTQLSYIPISRDSVEVSWQSVFPGTYSPVKRFRNYQKAKKISENFTEILMQMQVFFKNEKQVFGIDIKRDLVKNKLFLAIEKTSAVYPDINFVYDLVAILRKNIRISAGTETGYPMLSIYKPYKKNYIVTVAIPIREKIPTMENIKITNMVDGKLLFIEVTGGPNTIKNAFSSFHTFIKDKRLTSPAMPYEMMITDRKTESDTSKWITQIYYPVF